MPEFEFAVVGGGIAGLAVAELLQRSGRHVCLFEERDSLCAGSSAEQQGWFHTGALYAQLPDGRFFDAMVRNLDNLLTYYSCFPDMNLQCGRHVTSRKAHGWFGNTTNIYLYVSPHGFPPVTRILWSLAILRAITRLSALDSLDFSRDIAPQLGLLSLRFDIDGLRLSRPFGFIPGHCLRPLRSRDRAMDTQKIAADLLRSFLSADGVCVLGKKITRIRSSAICTETSSYTAKNIVVTSGNNTIEIGTSSLLHQKSPPLSITKSPLLVVKPALCDFNWVRMGPRDRDMVNHVFHCAPRGNYSVVGNGQRFNDDEDIAEEQAKDFMISQLEGVFSNYDSSCHDYRLYFGHKVELKPKTPTVIPRMRAIKYLPIVEQYYKAKQRYFMHNIHPISDNVIFALPGKFTLAFTLPIAVCRYFNIDPAVHMERWDSEQSLPPISKPVHYEKAELIDASCG